MHVGKHVKMEAKIAGSPVQCFMQVRRKELEQERAHLFPHIPLVEGILERALEPGTAVKVIASH